ncbi:MAG: sigma-70 family RNA polymerase sigma factor [Gammaproteobacteria bacterium]|nr:sigma-70 family RNA polymerase sigma factor [Gammaproteobacteria bacterium]
MHEQELVNRLIAGDEAAFRQVVSDYQGLMLYVARGIIDRDIAEEVVQDAWLAVLRALPKFEGRSSLKTWILQIVSNTAKSRRRHEIRSVAVGDAADIETLFKADGHWSEPRGHWHHDTPERLLESEQLQQALEGALQGLPDGQRAVLLLRDIEGLEIDDICKILDVSASNCRVLLHRARLRVWQTIDRFEKGEPE